MPIFGVSKPGNYRPEMATDDTTAEFAPIYIERCRISNFRGIDHCEIEFEPELTVLVGRNNAGKSRVLRAVGVALGLAADHDDLTVATTEPATIDLFVSPLPPTAVGLDEEFDPRLRQRLGQGVQVISEEPVRERFAWRTKIQPSSEGLGAKSETGLLTFDAGRREWVIQTNPTPLSRDQRQLLAVDLIGTRRDVVEDLGRRGSAIRRVLNDLEVADDTRASLEDELSDLGQRMVASSASLTAVRESLNDLDDQVGGLGKPALNPLPIRLEELGRSVEIDMDSGNGALPFRLHGAGSRSLASLQIQGVNYRRRLGQDGPKTRPHPITLVEEPEAHLHPQAEFELGNLLQSLPGQVITSTHSSHVVTSVLPRSIRLIRQQSDSTVVVDLGPADSDDTSVHRALRASTHMSEMEKLKRLVERPFGEMLFASALVLGDGSTERAFLPIAFSHALGSKAHGVCVIDPGSLKSEIAHAAIKFAKLVDIPWFLFSDSDGPGKADAKSLISSYADDDETNLVWISADGEPDSKTGSAIEHMMVSFDQEMCLTACLEVRPDADPSAKVLHLLKDAKGSVGSALARHLVEKHPDVTTWPNCLQELVNLLETRL